MLKHAWKVPILQELYILNEKVMFNVAYFFEILNEFKLHHYKY